MNRRQLLGGALLTTLLASAWLALQPDDDAAAPVAALARARPAAGAARAASAPAAPAATVERARTLAAWGKPPPAALVAWSAPPPVLAAASAPERLPPPRFPYTWIGQVDDGTAVRALLNGPQRSFGVRAGEVLDGRWRVEQIAATRLQLTFLPTGEAVNVDAR